MGQREIWYLRRKEESEKLDKFLLQGLDIVQVTGLSLRTRMNLHKVQYNLIRNILVSLIIFVVVVYFCTTSHYNKKKVMHYAQQLREYQLTLEERVTERTEVIKSQTQRNLRMYFLRSEKMWMRISPK